MVLYLVSDVISIKLKNKPLIYLSKEVNSIDIKYKGLLYDVNYCITDKTSYIIRKGFNFTCPSEDINSEYIYAVVMETSDGGAYIKGIRDNNNLKIDEVAFLIINEDTKLVGISELKTGLRIKVEADLIQETYPIRIVTKKVTVLDSPEFSIVDETEMCASALELIWSDYLYEYYLPCIKSSNIKIKFESSEVLLIDALEEHKITIEELISGGLSIYKETK
jgi:hypothetical protein